MVPSNDLPFNVIVEYDEWDMKYNFNSLKAIFNKTHFQQKEVSLEELEDTLNKATLIVDNYRGELARRDRKILYYLLGAGVFCFFLAILVGMLMQNTDSSPWFLTAFIVVLYLAGIYGVKLYFQHKSSYEYRMSQFLLAVFCRVENNRLYLRHGIEMRPGFLGKWIEFSSIDAGEFEDIILAMR